jgi:hypothetical protein
MSSGFVRLALIFVIILIQSGLSLKINMPFCLKSEIFIPGWAWQRKNEVEELSFSYSNSSKTTIIKKLCKSIFLLYCISAGLKNPLQVTLDHFRPATL